MSADRREPAVLISTRVPSEVIARLRNSTVGVGESDGIEIDGLVDVHWWLAPEAWHLAPAVRAELQSAGIKFDEKWPFVRAGGIAHPILSAVSMRPAFEPRARERYPRPQIEIRCPECRRTHDALPDNPKIEVALPNEVPGYFQGHNSGVGIMSQSLYRALEAAGLHRGLELFPIVTTPRTSETYFGTRARTQLRGPVAPFGSGADGGPPCRTCGRAWPRWGLYPLYERPSVDEDWFWAVPHGPSSPIVTARVYRFLEADADGLVGLGPSRNRLKGSRVGWAPDELGIAFLPERFRGITDAPVEPLRPGETPWL